MTLNVAVRWVVRPGGPIEGGWQVEDTTGQFPPTWNAKREVVEVWAAELNVRRP